MKRSQIILYVLVIAILILSGCKVETAANPAVSPSESATTSDSTSENITITVQHQEIMKSNSFDLTGESAKELIDLLNSLPYEKECCDGIPEYIIICPDQKRFDLNLSSGWAWLDEKETELSDETIKTIFAMFS